MNTALTELLWTALPFIPLLVLTVALANRLLLRRLNDQSARLVALHQALQLHHQDLLATRDSCGRNQQALLFVQERLHEEVNVHETLKNQVHALEQLLEIANTRTGTILTLLEVIERLMQTVYATNRELPPGCG